MLELDVPLSLSPLPQSTKLALSAFRCLRRSKPLCDMLENAKQGAPLEDLGSRTLTCVTAERAAQLLVMFVDNVQGPAEMLVRGVSLLEKRS